MGPMSVSIWKDSPKLECVPRTQMNYVSPISFMMAASMHVFLQIRLFASFHLQQSEYPYDMTL